MCFFKKTSSKKISTSDTKTNNSYGNLSNNSGIVGNVGSTINNSVSNKNLDEKVLIMLYRELDQGKKKMLLDFALELHDDNEDDGDEGDDSDVDSQCELGHHFVKSNDSKSKDNLTHIIDEKIKNDEQIQHQQEQNLMQLHTYQEDDEEDDYELF